MNRDSIMVRLLDACVHALRYQGMNRMYIDAVKGGEAGFQSIGKHSSMSFQSLRLWTNANNEKAFKNGQHTEKFGRAFDKARDVCLSPRRSLSEN